MEVADGQEVERDHVYFIRPGHTLTIKNVIVNGITGSPMPAWSLEKGGPLSSEEIDALVVYLLTWETNPDFPTTPQPTSTTRPPMCAATVVMVPTACPAASRMFSIRVQVVVLPSVPVMASTG